MNAEPLIEEKHAILKNKLLGNMKKKHVLELEITRQCEQLKRIEILMEKNSHIIAPEKTVTYSKDR
jgi:hypothetical protein